MDPLACWKRVCEAFAEGEIEEALWAMDDLQTWLKRGHRADGVPFVSDIIAARPFLEAVLRELNLHVNPCHRRLL